MDCMANGLIVDDSKFMRKILRESLKAGTTRLLPKPTMAMTA